MYIYVNVNIAVGYGMKFVLKEIGFVEEFGQTFGVS